MRVFAEFAETLHHCEQEKWLTVLRASSHNQNTWPGAKVQSLHDQGEDQHGKFVFGLRAELVLTAVPVWRECKTKPHLQRAAALKRTPNPDLSLMFRLPNSPALC